MLSSQSAAVDITSNYDHILGLGSVRSDDSERMTLKRDSAGDQLCLRMSMQMFPLSLMFT